MVLGIVVPTYWEVRSLIRRLPFQKENSTSYRWTRGPDSVFLEISGIGRQNAKKAVQKVLAVRPCQVFCVGFAGALKEGIQAGDIVVDSYRSDPAIVQSADEIVKRLRLKVYFGKFASSPVPLMTKQEKLQFALGQDAIAVEMESESAYQLCKESHVSFCSLRAVSDCLDQEFPLAVTALDSQGKVGFRFWKTLLANPSDWVWFVKIILSSKKAEKNLCALLSEYIQRSLT